MKLSSLLISFATATLLISSLSSCIEIDPPRAPKINTEKIAVEIKEKIEAEINTPVIGVTDSINADSTSIAISAGTTQQNKKISIDNISVNLNVDNDGYYRAIRSQQEGNIIISIIALVSVSILALIIALLVFLFKRAKRRSDIISKAIEHNYQLPESFYGRKDYFGTTIIKETDFVPNKSQTEKCDSENQEMPPCPPSIEDQNSQPKQTTIIYGQDPLFQKGFRNIALGIGIMLIFCVWLHTGFGLLGIIPLLIGVGQLLSYYGIGRRN